LAEYPAASWDRQGAGRFVNVCLQKNSTVTPTGSC